MKKLIGLYIVILLSGMFVSKTNAQMPIDSDEVIQFSGVVITEDPYGDIMPLSYTTIAVEGTLRGASSDLSGFFSFAALQGETVSFSRIGYKTVRFVIPDTLNNSMYSIVQIMSEDTILLPETVIFPWPSRKYFDIEFLAMDVSDVQREAARENLAPEIMDELRINMAVDGTEASKMLIRSQASSFSYYGQYKPQKIFDPLAWKKFIEAWKNGDFKSKAERDKRK